jgi:phytanoyl-CoA dioxygenase PhyH
MVVEARPDANERGIVDSLARTCSSKLEDYPDNCDHRSEDKMEAGQRLVDATGKGFSLAPWQLESFTENGFLSLPKLVSDEELGRLRAIYDRLFASRAGSAEGRYIEKLDPALSDGPRLPQILEPSKYAPELIESEFFLNAYAAARQVLGDDLESRHSEHMIYKPPHSGPATPWHQDQSRQDPKRRYRNVNVWLSLDDAVVANGCMYFVPGSHRREVIYSRPDKEATHAVACPVPAGGCTLHASYVLHYSGPNVSDVPRRAYILIFRKRPEMRATPILRV